MRRAALLLTSAATLAVLVASPSSGFSVDPVHTFIPVLRHGDGGVGVHEQITGAAVQRAFPSAPRNLISNLQYTTASTDFMHHFDGEYHFDGSSVRTHPERFVKSFKTIARDIAEARRYASGNAQFLKPTYRSLREIRAEVANVLGELAGRDDCSGCSTVRIKANQVRLALVVPALKAYPSPDPHRPTSRASLFHPDPAGRCGLCGRFGLVGRDFPRVVNEVEAVATYANTAASSLPASDPLRRKAVRLFQAVRAYRGYFELGHALHATQDFFTHANYVELMGGVAVGTPVPKDAQIPVLRSGAAWNLRGLGALMGADRYGRLQTGAVTAYWLNEEDTCMDPHNPYNPGRQRRVYALGSILARLGVADSPFQLWGGRNPNPPEGLNYCHYPTATVKGLHKDTPGELNHVAARKAATDMSIVLLREFFRSLGAVREPEPPAAAARLAGTWVGQDNGRYTISQAAGSKTVTWVGCSPDGGVTWWHAFTGTIQGGYLVGRFQDAPPGRNRNAGALALAIRSDSVLEWVPSVTVSGTTTTSFPTLTRTWRRATHAGCPPGGTATPPTQPAKWAPPTAATCPPAFTMETLQSLPPYAKTGEFSLTAPTLQRTYANGPYNFKCVYLHAQDRGEAFVIFIDAVPPNIPGAIPSGDCARTSPNTLASEKRYVSVSGGERRSFTRAAGGNPAILQQALRLAETQGVGQACPAR
jgi:hypothetical protein